MWFLLCPSGAAGMGADGTRRNEKIHRIQRNDSPRKRTFFRMKDFSGGDTENSTMKAGKTNMGRLSKVEISGVNTSKLPVLSREEAKVLFQQARAGSEEARQTLIQGNLRLVLSVIKKFDGATKIPMIFFRWAVWASLRELTISMWTRTFFQAPIWFP